MRFSLSWSYNLRGGTTSNPVWPEVDQHLSHLRSSQGTVSLESNNGSKPGPRQLQVRSNGHYYLLTLGLETEDDWIVRSYSSPAPLQCQIEILGDLWDANMVCSDFVVVTSAFKEFYDTCDVSKCFLN